MAKEYLLYQPYQLFLMPPGRREWLPQDHLACFVSELMDDLNLFEIEAVYEDEERGQPPYHLRPTVDSKKTARGLKIYLNTVSDRLFISPYPGTGLPKRKLTRQSTISRTAF